MATWKLYRCPCFSTTNTCKFRPKFRNFIYSYSGDLKLIILLYLFTFCFVLPILCKSWPHSIYYRKSNKTVIEQEVRERNNIRYQGAKEYFLKTNKRFINKLDRHYNYALGIITMRRSNDKMNDNYGFLIQTAASIHKQMNDNTAFFICNVDEEPEKHTEAQSLSEFIPVITRRNKAKGPSLFEDEKQDYQFCLSAASRYNANYTILMEDDVLLNHEFFTTLNNIMNRFFQINCKDSYCRKSEKWLFFKLFYPEKWSGYGLELKHITEKFGIFSISIGLFSGLLYIRKKRRLHIFLLALVGIYFVLLAHAIGRPYINSLRNLYWQLLEVIPAKGCCTQCVLYPKYAIDGIVKYLNTVSCSKDYPIDIALDDYAKKEKLKTWLLEPNLSQHIGFKSSLKTSPSYEHFLN